MLKNLGKYVKNLFTSQDDNFYMIRSELKEVVGWLLLVALLIMMVVSEFGRTMLTIVACALTVIAAFAALSCAYICARTVVKHYKMYSEATDTKRNYAADDAPYFVERPEQEMEERPMVYFWDRGTLMKNSAALYNCSLTGTFNKVLFGQEADDMLITSDEEIEGFRQLDGDKKSAAYEMYISYIRANIRSIPEREIPEIRLSSGDGWSYVPMTANEVLVARLIDYRNIEGVDVTIVTQDGALEATALNNGFKVVKR